MSAHWDVVPCCAVAASSFHVVLHSNDKLIEALGAMRLLYYYENLSDRYIEDIASHGDISEHIGSTVYIQGTKSRR